MCRACEEEALYQAYLDQMAKKATEAAARNEIPADRAVCEDVKTRAREARGKQ